ncbi:MAG TPA: PAS domain S-box protein [Steroidobacteraceae bacterium]|nr:PAS domain S-box protein [Steroidobacteraceae bacterium]
MRAQGTPGAVANAVCTGRTCRHALDAAPDAMIIIDVSGAIRFANRQVCALFGYAHDEIVGHAVEDLMPERFPGRHTGHRKHYGDNPQDWSCLGAAGMAQSSRWRSALVPSNTEAVTMLRDICSRWVQSTVTEKSAPRVT